MLRRLALFMFLLLLVPQWSFLESSNLVVAFLSIQSTPSPRQYSSSPSSSPSPFTSKTRKVPFPSVVLLASRTPFDDSNANNKNNNNNNKNQNSNDPDTSSSLSSPSSSGSSSSGGSSYEDFFNSILTWLAQLSLKDYQWRQGMFQQYEADRMVETAMARMRGENATYVRPMDAPTTGPLGKLESKAVATLQAIFQEEGHRAQQIVLLKKLIRPLELTNNNNNNNNNDNNNNNNAGETNNNDALPSSTPLGKLEQRVVQFFDQIRNEEQERIRTKTLRPKDLNVRGPLGELEFNVTSLLNDIRESEQLRMTISKQRNLTIIRPIDIPGPLGELELKVAEIFQAERRRATKERQLAGGKLVRPKDARIRGPLGEAELSTLQTIQQLNAEEMERLKSIQKTLQDNRPMETNRDSILGKIEALVVGIIRAPRLLKSVLERVQELLNAEPLVISSTETTTATTTTTTQDDNNNKSKKGKKNNNNNNNNDDNNKNNNNNNKSNNKKKDGDLQ